MLQWLDSLVYGMAYYFTCTVSVDTVGVLARAVYFGQVCTTALSLYFFFKLRFSTLLHLSLGQPLFLYFPSTERIAFVLEVCCYPYEPHDLSI